MFLINISTKKNESNKTKPVISWSITLNVIILVVHLSNRTKKFSVRSLTLIMSHSIEKTSNVKTSRIRYLFFGHLNDVLLSKDSNYGVSRRGSSYMSGRIEKVWTLGEVMGLTKRITK